MDIEKIFKDKNISESSIKLYLKNLIRLNDNKPIKTINFLKDSKKIMEKIKDKAPTTQRSYIISIVSLLKQLEGQKNKILYNDYFDILEKFNTNLKDRTAKTENEKECWMSNDDIKKIYDNNKIIIDEIKNKKKLTEEQHDKLLSFLILSLYYLHPPRRNLDYQLMNVIKNNNELDDKINYLNLSNKQFIFNQYKTKGKYEKQIVEINKNLMDVINIYLKFHPLKKDASYKLLVHFDGNPLTNNNDITRILNKIFKCKIGSSMLRKMYHTNKYGAVLNELKKDGDKMAHSVETILNNYIKK